MEAIEKLTKDEKLAATTLGRLEARYLVDMYYQMQDNRISSGNQLRAASESGEPNSLLEWYATQSLAIEKQLKIALEKYSQSGLIGRWAMAQKGIGPVIAAGFLSRLELRPTVGAWWRFCGLDPTSVWGKGEVRPWNADLKRLCWLTGQSFVKVHNYDDAFYGKLYVQRKDWETAKNEKGDYAETARLTLETKDWSKDTVTKKTYLEGKLPPARIHSRACRYATKIFLSHLHAVWHMAETGTPAPTPFVIQYMGHVDLISVPLWDEFFKEPAYRAVS